MQAVGALSTPFVKGYEWWVEDQPARVSWSRNDRLFYGAEGFEATSTGG